MPRNTHGTSNINWNLGGVTNILPGWDRPRVPSPIPRGAAQPGYFMMVARSVMIVSIFIKRYDRLLVSYKKNTLSPHPAQPGRHRQGARRARAAGVAHATSRSELSRQRSIWRPGAAGRANFMKYPAQGVLAPPPGRQPTPGGRTRPVNRVALGWISYAEDSLATGSGLSVGSGRRKSPGLALPERIRRSLHRMANLIKRCSRLAGQRPGGLRPARGPGWSADPRRYGWRWSGPGP